MKGIVVKKLADDFWVKTDGSVFVCKPRGNLKAKGVFVGDKVEISQQDDIFVVDKVDTRTNILIRPPLANLDQLLIVVSPTPKPDYMIVDKLILFAYSYGIKPIIVINKQDISPEINDYVKNTYSSIIDIVFVSAKTKSGLDNLKQVLKGKISAFAGQSAVGKSALINALFGKSQKEGDLSQKIERGKNTTRHCEIFYNDDIMIADTAGFTSLDETLLPIAYYELPYYYHDYNVYKDKCKYTSCVHVKENTNECMVKQKVEQGVLDKNRYDRYVKIYEILKQKWERTHG